MPQKDHQFWAQFLPEIKKTIEATLASLEEREEILASLSETSEGTFSVRLDEVRSRIENSARRPEESMAAADALLEDAEAAYRSKLAGIETLRKKLADWLERNAA